MKYYIANWKANKTLTEAIEWIDQFLTGYKSDDNTQVILCPPAPFLITVKEEIKNYPNIHLGAQDISHFEEGVYTGEITAKNYSGIIDHVILGHSERRKYFNETEEILAQKFGIAKNYNLKTIYCLRDENDFIPPLVDFICYEPVNAISSGDGKGSNESLENILLMKQKFNLLPDQKFIYGGSVNEENIKEYISHDEIDGVLIGGASLDPHRFLKLIL